LRKQLAELNKNPVEGFSAGLIDDDDIFRWEVTTESSDRMPRFSQGFWRWISLSFETGRL
jgi:ubiquitin-protein ligase